MAEHQAHQQIKECNKIVAAISPTRKNMAPQISFTGLDKDSGDCDICDF